MAPGSRPPCAVTHLPLPLGLLVLEGEEAQVGRLQLRLAGFQEAADVPVDAGARGGLGGVGTEGQAVPELLRGCSQGPALGPSGRKGPPSSHRVLRKGLTVHAPPPTAPTPSTSRRRPSLEPEMQSWPHRLLAVTTQVSHCVITGFHTPVMWCGGYMATVWDPCGDRTPHGHSGRQQPAQSSETTGSSKMPGKVTKPQQVMRPRAPTDAGGRRSRPHGPEGAKGTPTNSAAGRHTSHCPARHPTRRTV